MREIDDAARPEERNGPDSRPDEWLVDGFNVLHAHLLRGRDRSNWRGAERQRLVIEQAERLAARGQRVCVVFDGAPPASEAAAARPPALRVVFARDADAWILEALRSAPEPARVAVVTGDREIKDGARRRGARVVSPRAWLALCAEPADLPVQRPGT